MSANGSVQIAGTLGFAGGNRSGEISLSQVIDELEVKSFDVNALCAATVFTPVALQLSSGVDEALFVHVYCAQAILVELTDQNGDTVEFGLKGHAVWTFSPDNGLVALGVKNEHATDDATVTVTVGAKRNATDDDPSFWDEE